MFNPLSGVQSAVLAQHLPQFSPQQRRERRREWFGYQLNSMQLPGIGREEIEAHFNSMPARYWESVDEAELVWGLQTIHKFLHELAVPDSPGTMPIVESRHFPDRGFTQLMVCTWDRHGLLSKVAGALSALGINILQADVYTRSDGIVLDIFRIAEIEGRPVSNPGRWQEITFLIEGALSEPPRFASLWACSRHKFVGQPQSGPPAIAFDNSSSADSTVLTIEATDRLGLLYDILAALADGGINIGHALIDTEDDVARDTFYIADGNGQKISDPVALQGLRDRVTKAVVS
jgi:[protein-PII] uridylyltransferase